jgi:hypothetical protein
LARELVDRVNTPPSIDVASCTTSSLPMVRMTRFAGRRSLGVAELHFALFGDCLPAMVEFGCHYPSVGHAPKFREIVFVVSQNEHDFGVFLPYWITVDDGWFTVGSCTWAREQLAAAAANNPARRKRIRSLAAVTFTVLGSRVGTGRYTPGHRRSVFDR